MYIQLITIHFLKKSKIDEKAFYVKIYFVCTYFYYNSKIVLPETVFVAICKSIENINVYWCQNIVSQIIVFLHLQFTIY